LALDANSIPQETKDKELAVAAEKTREELIGKAVDAALKKAGINPAHVDSEEHMASNCAKGWITEEQVEMAKKIKEEEGAKKAATLNEKQIEQIAMGRLNKFFKENTLVEQEYIMESKMTVRQFIESTDKELTCTGFKRLELGA
jgi:elongation factor Ts